MKRRSPWIVLFLAATAVAPGCARLNHSQTLSLNAKDAKAVFALPIPTGDEKITVTAASPGAPVAVYLVATTDVNTEIDMLQLRGKIDNEKLVLGKTDKGENVALEATLHANDDVNLVVHCGDKDAKEVKITVIGR
jgi:hypothetical protein